MKRILCIFTLLALVLGAFVGCNPVDKIKNNNSDPEEKKLFLTEYVLHYTATDNTERTLIFYNSHGLPSVTEFYKNGVLLHSENYKYDENGYLIYSKKFAEVELEMFYTNDEAGRTVERRQRVLIKDTYSEITTSISYPDENGSYIENTSDSDGNTSEIAYLYDEKGNLAEIKYSTGSVKYTNTYDENGRLVRQTNDMQEPSWVTEYEYDKYGNLIKESSFDPTGVLVSYIEYIYSDVPVSE